MIAVARMSEDRRPVSLTKVARHTQLSKRYLEKLVSMLKKASLLRPVPGRAGGYLLTRAAEDIRIGQIVEASIGPINIVECVKHPEACWKSDFCECRIIYRLINERITEALNEYSLADMTKGKWREDLSQQLDVDSEIADAPAMETAASTGSRPTQNPDPS